MKTSILEQIASSNRLPILFIGSGISKRYLYNYPSWPELLENSFAKFEPDMFQYHKYITSFKKQQMSEFEINAKLGSIIEDQFNAAFFDRKIKLNIGNSKNPSWVKRGISPYKMYLSSFFKQQKVNRNPALLAEIEKFKLLKNKISAVITTNYDTFLETVIFPDDYQVFVHQNELFSSDSYNIAEIYKIHGSATDANSIIITEEDYKHFKETRKLIIAKMLTLFAESPIIFLGYSFTDEDVRDIIEDFLSCLTPKELKDIRKHFVFISYKQDEKELIEIERTIQTRHGTEIPFIEIQTDNYSQVYDILNKLTPGISPIKVRETRKVVKTIVDQSLASTEAESVIVGIDDLDKVDLTSKPLAIAIGYRENILNQFGYGALEDKLIWEDILYDNKHFNAESMCVTRFKSIATSRLLPVYKYVKQAKSSIPTDSRLNKYIASHDTLEKIVSKNVEKTLKNIEIITDYTRLLTQIDSITEPHKASGIVLKNFAHLSNEELRNLCKFLYEKYGDKAMDSTHFKRCVMCLDFRENKE